MISVKDRVKQIDGEIIKLFESYSFRKLKRNISEDNFIYIFVKQKLFIILKGSINVYDYPGYINIIVGKGDYTYPALDKTGYSLWRIARYVEHNDTYSEYPFDILYNKDIINILRRDVEKYLMPFINNGDMYWIGDDISV